jgi:hypothetical protein
MRHVTRPWGVIAAATLVSLTAPVAALKDPSA